MNYSSVSNRGYRYGSPSSAMNSSTSYQHKRRKTQWGEPSYFYPYDYDYLQANQQIYHSKADLFMQLEEEKLYNRRSNVIIEELLQQKKKRQKQELIANRLAKQEAYQRERQLRKQRNQLKSSKLYEQFQQLRRDQKQKLSRTPQKTDKKANTKQQILSKLYEKPTNERTPKQTKNQQSPKKLEKQKQKLEKDKQKQKQQKQKYNEIQILTEEVNFLKQQLKAKNNNIVQLQLEIVRLQKIEKLMANMQKIDQVREQVEEDVVANEEDVGRKMLGMCSRSWNVMIQSKRNKGKFKLINMESCTVQGTIKEVKIEKYAQTEKQLIRTSQNYAQTNEQQSQIKLQLSSNIMCYSLQVSSKLGQSQIDFNLSSSGPTEIKKTREREQNKAESSEKESQTQGQGMQNRQCQTSDNYYDYIENTYLEWMFEKDYKQMSVRKKKEGKEQK